MRSHDLRHTFATNTLAHEMDIKTLPTFLNHVSSATTLNTYSHVTDELRQRAAVKIDQGIAKAEVQDDLIFQIIAHILISAFQMICCWVVDQFPVLSEAGTVTWAIPGVFDGIPFQCAAQVGTAFSGRR